MIHCACPSCGSTDDVRAVETVLQTTTVTAWSIGEDGLPRADEYGDDCKTYYENCDPYKVPFDCSECGWEGQTKDLVVLHGYSLSVSGLHTCFVFAPKDNPDLAQLEREGVKATPLGNTIPARHIRYTLPGDIADLRAEFETPC